MLQTITCIFLLVFACAPVAAEDWRGIKPGQSTRQDVVREFGRCSDLTQPCEINLPQEDLYITFSGPDLCQNDVPPGTVLLIERQLADPATMPSLNLNPRKFKRFDPTWPRRIGYQGYLDDKAGLVMKAFNHQVFQINYVPVASQRKLCPTYYRNPKAFVETYVEHAPMVFLKCPKDPVLAGDVLHFKAEYNRGLSIVLIWNVSAGRIVEGQGRRYMALDTSGLEGQTISVGISRADSNMFVSNDSCRVKISASPTP